MSLKTIFLKWKKVHQVFIVLPRSLWKYGGKAENMQIKHEDGSGKGNIIIWKFPRKWKLKNGHNKKASQASNCFTKTS